MMDLNNYLKENKFKNKDTNKLNRVSATIVEAVLEVDENGNEIPLKYNGNTIKVDNIKYAMARIMGYENLQLVLPNRTNAPLKFGDNVWIYYWKDVSSGYIALNNTNSPEQTFSNMMDLFNRVHLGTIKTLVNGEEIQLWHVEISNLGYNPSAVIASIRTQGNFTEAEIESSLQGKSISNKLGVYSYIDNDKIIFHIYNSTGILDKKNYYIDYIAIE